MKTMKPIDATRILTRSEIVAVLADLKRLRRSVNSRQNLVVFRLATCCGLRVSEVCGLKLGNLKLTSARPHVVVPASIAKRGTARKVPLWWDAGTLADLTAWKSAREAMGAGAADPVVCSLAKRTQGKPLAVRNAQNRYKKCLKPLGAERVACLSIHSGRHSFCSHSLAGGRNLAEVRDAAGHANIATTSIYLHSAVDDDETVGNLFSF
jgi:integrase/recombinase XerD